MGNDKVDQLLELALYKLPHHDISGALQVLDEAGELEPDNVELGNIKGNCYYLLGDFYQAKQAWEKVLEWDNNNKTALTRLEKFESPAFQFWLKRYYRAIEDIENKDFLAAQNSLLKLMRENDGFVSLYQLLGLTYLALNDEKNAMQVWQQGLKMDISNEELNRYVNTPKKGIKKKKAIASPDNKQSQPKSNIVMMVAGMFVMLLLLQMSISFNSDKDYKSTIQSMQDKINLLSDQLALEQSSPTIAAANSDTASLGDEETEEVLSNEGSNYDIEKEKHYYKTGYQAYQAKDWKTAVSNLSVVVSMLSNNYINREALYYLARTYYVSQDYDNAEKYYLTYLEQFPNTNYTDECLYYLGCLYYYKGDIEAARAMLNQLELYDPQSGYKSTELYHKIKS